jgi:hypothetical protein
MAPIRGGRRDRGRRNLALKGAITLFQHLTTDFGFDLVHSVFLGRQVRRDGRRAVTTGNGNREGNMPTAPLHTNITAQQAKTFRESGPAAYDFLMWLRDFLQSSFGSGLTPVR